jgi:hypothetical protein
MLDYSWTQVLHLAFVRHLQFGRDIVFTSGPWGFLGGGFYPQTFALSVVLWTIFSIIFWWAAWRMASHFSSNELLSWFWLVCFIEIAGFPDEESLDIRIIAWVVLLLYLYFFIEGATLTARQVLLTISLGMLSLTKFTGLIEATVVVCIIAADSVFCRRRFPWIILLFGTSVFVFWIAAGQHLDLFWPFLKNSWKVTDGYTEAMMWSGINEIPIINNFLLLAAMPIMLTSYMAWERHRFFGIFPAAGLGAIVFLIFKHGYVRYDHFHETPAIMGLSLMVMACLATAWPTIRNKSRWTGFAFATVMLGVLFSCLSGVNSTLSLPKLNKKVIVIFNPRSSNLTSIPILARSLCDAGYLPKVYEENLADVRDEFPLPPINGDVDIYPWNQTVLFAHNLNFHPRPTLQSYSAYTPELAELNAALLRSTQAVKNILFDVDPIDNHFPSLDDGLSWLELLTRYDIAGATKSFVLLKHSATPRNYHLTLLEDRMIYFNRPVTLPVTNKDPIWAKMEINDTLAGFMFSKLYKPPILKMTVLLRDGRQMDFRLVSGMTRSGFILSPLILDKKRFVALASTDGLQALTNFAVTSITISAGTESASTTCYQSPMHLRLYHLDFPRQDLDKMQIEKELH